MPDEFEILVIKKVSDVRLSAGKEVIEADDIVAFRDQPLARVDPVRICRGAWLGQNAVIMPGNMMPQ